LPYGIGNGMKNGKQPSESGRFEYVQV